MATAKTTTLAHCIEPRLKEAMGSTAERVHRRIANMIEVMIGDYCGRNGVTIPETGALLIEKGREQCSD